MSIVLSEPSRVLVDDLLNGTTDAARRQVLAQLSTLPAIDQQGIATFLVERLPKEADGWKRAWTVSALAAINIPQTAEVIAARMDPKKEAFEWTRYWATIALAGMKPDDLDKHLKAALKDPAAIVKAVALRLLIENGAEDYVEQLLDAARDQEDWYERFAACKALRRTAGHPSLPPWIEQRCIPILEDCLTKRDELLDVRDQAARALGDIAHAWPEAIKALRRALEGDLPDWVRRACVDALATISKRETRDALLFVLQDKDAEIRVRAANALKCALGPSDAVRFIAERALQQDQPSVEYIDALRQIDNAEAARVLSESLAHPDPKAADRAARVLERLGGEAAARTLQRQRTQALETYTKLLGDADAKIMRQFEGLMQHAGRAFYISMMMHGVIFAIGVGTLIFSLYLALGQGLPTFERYIGLGSAAGSLGTLLLLFYKDPLKRIGHSVTSLVKVNVVFLGYVRQINQIDATFKQLFLASTAFGTSQMKETVVQIQDSVGKTMEDVKTYLVD